MHRSRTRLRAAVLMLFLLGFLGCAGAWAGPAGPGVATVPGPVVSPAAGPGHSPYGVGYHPGANRGRGLPIAVAVVLLLGVGSGVLRAVSLDGFVTRTTLLPRISRGR